MNGTNRTRAAAAALVVALVAALLGVAAGPASAGVLEPKGKQIYFGVSDTGDPASFGEFCEAVSKHPAVIESFRAWGSEVRDSIQRWEIARARPMIHITTADPQTGAEILTLAAIANGAGDSFLIRLNHLFAEKQMRAYVRPLGEPNRCLNVYAAYECAGHPRSAADSARNYRRAFRRIYVIVHGGGKAKLINARLAEAGPAAAERRTSAGCRRRRWRSSGARSPPARRRRRRTCRRTSTPATNGSTGPGPTSTPPIPNGAR